MRKTIGALVVMMALAAGGRLAGAQIVDPSTGMMVDAATDPMDFTAIMTGQPTNVGMEAMMSAAAQAQQMADQNMAMMQDSTDASMSAMNSSDDTPVARAPALPVTRKPVITPGGGTFKTSLQVTIADSDSAAAVFYTTDGTKPTTSSRRYEGPIEVSGTTKVQALAFDVSMQPSGVVSKTFKVKAAKGS